MNAKQKIHQTKLSQWAVRFQEQKASGLTVKDWCEENNFTIHTYNYWKHLLKQEYVDSVLPDIVPIITAPSSPPVLPNHQMPTPIYQSRDSFELHDTTSIHISIGDIHMDVGSSVPEEKLIKLIKAVRDA